MDTKTCQQSKRTHPRLHTVTNMAKKIINFKISQELIKHLQDEEEEYDNKYTDYCENVTTNDGQDGRALLAKYFEILDQFNKTLEIEKEKQAEQKEKRNKNKLNKMFHNIINRQLGNANAMTRLKGQGQLIHLAKSIKEIGIGQLSEHLKHIHELNEAMEVVHDTLSDVWTYSLNHHHLLQIADVFECRLTVDWRYSESEREEEEDQQVEIQYDEDEV